MITMEQDIYDNNNSKYIKKKQWNNYVKQNKKQVFEMSDITPEWNRRFSVQPKPENKWPWWLRPKTEA